MFTLPPALRNLLGTNSQILPVPQNMPLFITGTMRSGTTLLVNKLTQHPQLLKVGSELNEIWTEIGGANCLDQCEYRSEEHADFRYSFQMSAYFFKYINESKSLKRHLMRSVNVRKMQEGRVFYDWQNIIPVNKSTHLINKINYVNTLFPQSKFIFIIRDIFEQSSSLKFHFQDIAKRTGKVNFMPSDEKDCWSSSQPGIAVDASKNALTNFSSIPSMWIRLNLLALRELSQLDRSGFAVIHYNDLIENQGATLESLFDFLNLNSKHKQIEKKIANKHSRFKNTTTQGNPLEKWKTMLSDREKILIDNVIKEKKSEYNEIQNLLEQLKV